MSRVVVQRPVNSLQTELDFISRALTGFDRDAEYETDLRRPAGHGMRDEHVIAFENMHGFRVADERAADRVVMPDPGLIFEHARHLRLRHIRELEFSPVLPYPADRIFTEIGANRV